MANFRKSFNLRNGVQVDDNNFIVNPNGLVGIGTTIPEETLDVRGSVKVVGIITTNNFLAENLQATKVLNVGVTSITSGIVTSSTGIITYYGDGSKLLNLPTSQWVDIDVGLGFTSIYAAGFVGVGTIDPRYPFQVGGSNDLNNFVRGVGIDRTGNINATGIVTSSQFSGSGSALTNLNANNVSSGTLSVDRLPIIPNTKIPDSFQVAGIITALGGFSGVAFTAINLTSDARINIDNISALTSTIGVSTISSRLRVSGSIGVNTDSPQADVHIVDSASSTLHLTSTESTITVGRSVSPTGNAGGIKFGNTLGIYPYSDGRTLDIFNYDVGNINYYLDYGSAGVGTGNFNWIAGQNPTVPLMSLTYQGNLGLGVTNPTSKLQVSGNLNTFSLNVTENVVATGAGSSASVRTLYVYGGKTQILNADGTEIFPEPVGGDSNVDITSGVSTFFDINVTNNGIFGQNIGIGNTVPLGALHIGNYINDIENSVLITPNGIGLGTDLSTSEVYFDALSKNAVFGAVGIGTNDIDVGDPNIFYVNGNTYLSGNVGVGIASPTSKLTVRDGDIAVGVNTSHGLILTAANGNKYRLFVSNTGVLSTVLVP
jgi:hypothetical protein